MNLFCVSLLAACTIAALTPIQNLALAVSYPDLGAVLGAGNDCTITWATSPVIPEVNIVLRSGNQADLRNEFTIARNVRSTGRYVWHIPDSMKTATGLSIMIHDSRDPAIANYSPYFTILAAPFSVSVTARSSLEPTVPQPHRPTETIKVHISEKHPHRIVDSAHGEAVEALATENDKNTTGNIKYEAPVDSLNDEDELLSENGPKSIPQFSSLSADPTAARANASVPVPIKNVGSTACRHLFAGFLPFVVGVL